MRALGHRPGFENAVQFEPQIVVQARCIMLLDDEPPTGRGLDSVLAAWLLRLPEVALRFVGGQLIVCHRQSWAPDKNASYKNMFRMTEGAARKGTWLFINREEVFLLRGRPRGD